MLARVECSAILVTERLVRVAKGPVGSTLADKIVEALCNF